MKEYTYIEFLIEDRSGSILIEEVMKKYTLDKPYLAYKIHGFKGIGRLPQKAKSIGEVKSKCLLTDLPLYLKGMDAALTSMPAEKAIFVILDGDNEDCAALKRELVKKYHELNIKIKVFFCIAIEEMEAWLLGDRTALLEAYPDAKRNLLEKYVPDSIVGTWECLADIVLEGGVKKLKKSSSYYEIGAFKCECARKIGANLSLLNNNSPSFNYFIKKLNAFCDASTECIE